MIDFGSPMTRVLDVSRDDDSSSRDTFESPDASMAKLAWDLFSRVPRSPDELTHRDESPTSSNSPERQKWEACDKEWEEYGEVLEAITRSDYSVKEIIAYGIEHKFAGAASKAAVPHKE